MIWLKPYIAKIEQLLEADTPESLTYAALECRLAIERICYERLRVAHKYIAHSDLKRWQPHYVVNTLLAEVDRKIATSFTLSMSTTPIDPSKGAYNQNDFESHEYVEVGRQVGFDPKYLGKLWQALSSFIHVRLPADTDDEIATYATKERSRVKVEEALEEIRRISEGTMISTGIGHGGEVSFECPCGFLNKRRAEMLKPGEVLSCINPSCVERWKALSDGEEWEFQRQSLKVYCRECSAEHPFAEKVLLNLEKNRPGQFDCIECSTTNYVMWKLMQVAPTASPKSQ